MDPQQPPQPTTPKAASFNWVFAIVLLISLGIAGAGVYLALREQGWTLLAAGGVSVVATLLAWALASVLQSHQQLTRADLEESLAGFHERFEQFSVMLNLISEQQLLSDRGKSIAYRNKDREALRYAIQEEINRADYEAALKLADEMDASFGVRQEADHFRRLIDERKQEVHRRQVAEAMSSIDRHIRTESWPSAIREAEALAQRFPEDANLQSLANDIETRRQTHKKQLLDSFHDAVSRHDVDAAMVLMKRLDTYLSPAEGEALQETARSIVKAKLESLREQFARAVHESKWNEALRIGDVIVREFPNTQMAKEVRDVLETLKQRAAVPAGA